MKKLMLVFCSFFIVTSTFAINMAYVEVNSSRFENVRCYIKANSNSQPFFNIAAIFAANINGASPDEPQIYLNENVVSVLNSPQIKNMQDNGIKVLLTLLGNHQNAGWACMTDPIAAKKFADEVVALVNQYHLDGIDIDDEYSRCPTNNYSMIMMAEAIKNHPGFKGKLLTKALFSDYSYFKGEYNGHKLSEYLDYGWEMSYFYSNFEARLAYYLQNGMPKEHLMIGGWAQQPSPSPISIGQFTTNNKLAGVMVYDITKDSEDYLSKLAQGMEGEWTKIEVAKDCLQDK